MAPDARAGASVNVHVALEAGPAEAVHARLDAAAPGHVAADTLGRVEHCPAAVRIALPVMLLITLASLIVAAASVAALVRALRWVSNELQVINRARRAASSSADGRGA